MARRDQGLGGGSELPAPGVEERSDEAPGAGASPAGAVPDPEVVAKPTRRQFTAEYRLRILEEADRCTDRGEVGRLLRREGLYSSHLANWRKARREGALSGLKPKKRGRKPAEANPLTPKVKRLEAKVKRLEKELAAAHTRCSAFTVRRLSPRPSRQPSLQVQRGRNHRRWLPRPRGLEHL